MCKEVYKYWILCNFHISLGIVIIYVNKSTTDYFLAKAVSSRQRKAVVHKLYVYLTFHDKAEDFGKIEVHSLRNTDERYDRMNRR